MPYSFNDSRAPQPIPPAIRTRQSEMVSAILSCLTREPASFYHYIKRCPTKVLTDGGTIIGDNSYSHLVTPPGRNTPEQFKAVMTAPAFILVDRHSYLLMALNIPLFRRPLLALFRPIPSCPAPEPEGHNL